MRRSTEKILATHTGSLPRPADLREMWSRQASGYAEGALQARLRSAVGEVVVAQKQAGIDIPNDGEVGKPMRAGTDRGAWGNYIFNRVSGFVRTPPEAVPPDTAVPGRRCVSSVCAGSNASSPSSTPTPDWARRAPPPAGRCAPVRSPYTGHEALRRDLENLKAAKDAAGVEDVFVASIAPGKNTLG